MNKGVQIMKLKNKKESGLQENYCNHIKNLHIKTNHNIDQHKMFLYRKNKHKGKTTLE